MRWENFYGNDETEAILNADEKFETLTNASIAFWDYKKIYRNTKISDFYYYSVAEKISKMIEIKRYKKILFIGEGKFQYFLAEFAKFIPSDHFVEILSYDERGENETIKKENYVIRKVKKNFYAKEDIKDVEGVDLILSHRPCIGICEIAKLTNLKGIPFLIVNCQCENNSYENTLKLCSETKREEVEMQYKFQSVFDYNYFFSYCKLEIFYKGLELKVKK